LIDLPENELALRAQAGDEDAAAELIETTARSFRRFTPDEIQEARIATWSAILRFDPSYNRSFFAYARKCAYSATLEMARQRRYSPPPVGLAESAPSCEADVAATQLSLRMKVLVAKRLDATERVIFFEQLLPGPEAAVGYRALGSKLRVSHETARTLTRALERRLPAIFAELRDAL
jgi:DNA-directed RNA polymerase sigma subunit (sigma70/sigma32)